MRKQKLFWMLLCPLLLAACSTAPVQPTVVAQTKTEILTPPEALMVLCEPATPVPTKKVRDIVQNGLGWQKAYGTCEARMKCLVGWIRSVEAGASTPDCDINVAPPAPAATNKPPTKAPAKTKPKGK